MIGQVIFWSLTAIVVGCAVWTGYMCYRCIRLGVKTNTVLGYLITAALLILCAILAVLQVQLVVELLKFGRQLHYL